MKHKKKSGQKHTFFDTLKVGDVHELCEYSAKKMQSFSRTVIYYNTHRGSKRFKQRGETGGMLEIVRVKNQK